MTTRKNEPGASTRTIVDTMIRIAVLALLLYWSFGIIKPFLGIILWSAIFAIALHPAHQWLSERLKGRKILSAALIVTLMLLIVAIPGFLFSKSLYDGISFLKEYYETEKNVIPELSESVSDIPVIGPFLYEKWNSFSMNAGETITRYAPQIKDVAVKAASLVASAGMAFINLIASIIVSGILLIKIDQLSVISGKFFVRLAGERGNEISVICLNTVRTVMKSVLGVSFIQSSLFGIGMIVAGVPAAGVWFIIALFLSIIQIGIFPISLPVIIYVFSVKSTGTIIFFVIWSLFVSVIDNVLKPIFIGRGTAVPMAVTFIGSIGGFIYSGLVGLFTGAVIFSVVYRLYLFWMDDEKSAVPDKA